MRSKTSFPIWGYAIVAILLLTGAWLWLQQADEQQRILKRAAECAQFANERTYSKIAPYIALDTLSALEDQGASLAMIFRYLREQDESEKAVYGAPGVTRCDVKEGVAEIHFPRKTSEGTSEDLLTIWRRYKGEWLVAPETVSLQVQEKGRVP